MKYGQIEGVDKPVSKLFLGTATIPADIDSGEWLSSVVATGVNALDTARVYPDSEKKIGKWLLDFGRREEIVILSKCCHPVGPLRRVRPGVIKREIEKSLSMLCTNYIDIYLVHRDDPGVNAGDIVEAFNELKSAGKIRAFGVSNWTHRRIEEANEYAYKNSLIPFCISSPAFSLAEQTGVFGDKTCITISGSDKGDAREWYRESQFPILAYAPLGHGLLSGRLRWQEVQNIGRYLDKYAVRGFASEDNYERLHRCEIIANRKHLTVPQVALAWLFSQKMNLFAVVNTSNPLRMMENAEALDVVLSDDECQYLDLQKD